MSVDHEEEVNVRRTCFADMYPPSPMCGPNMVNLECIKLETNISH
jgi:hypothetical protein